MLAQVWGCRSLGTTQARAPPFRLSGGLVLLQGPEARVGVPPRLRLALAAAQTRGEGAPAPMRLQWRGWSLASEPGAPDGCGRVDRYLCVRGCARVCAPSRPRCRPGARCGSPSPATSRVDAAQLPPDRAPAVLGGVCVRWVAQRWKDVLDPASPAPSQADGEPRRPQPHALPGAAAGPRAPAAVASPASMHQRVVKAGCGTLLSLLPTW